MKTYISAFAFAAVFMSSNVHAEADTLDVALDLYFGIDAQQSGVQAPDQNSRIEIPAAN
jgi:hypothetical protein